MRPSRAQQALAALAVLFVVSMTILGGVILAFAEGPVGDSEELHRTPVAGRSATATPPPIPTSASATPLPPTRTPSALPTSAPSPTATLPPTVTLQPSVTVTMTSCQIHAGWVPYVVQRGDTLFEIGLRYNLTVDQLREGNCLADNSLVSGQVIYVPPVTPIPPITTRPPVNTSVPTSVVTLVATLPTGYDGICTDPNSIITTPRVGSVLHGVAQFYGTAVHPNFQFYKLEIRQEGTTTSRDFITFYTGYEQVTDGLLGELYTEAFPNGEYWVRLLVVDNTANYIEGCSILYTIHN